MARNVVHRLWLCTALVGGSFSAGAIDLPTVNLRYETAQGIEETLNDEDELLLEPRYGRHTFVNRIRQPVTDGIDLELETRFSRRYAESNTQDTDSIALRPRLFVDVSELLGVDTELIGTAIRYRAPDPAEPARDYDTVGGKVTIAYRFDPWPGSDRFGRFRIDSWAKTTFDRHHERSDKDRQQYIASLGLAGSVNDLTFSSRYRLTRQLPLAGAADVDARWTHVGSVSLRWTP